MFIFVLGGYNGAAAPFYDIERYNTETNAWVSLGAMAVPRIAFGVAQVGNDIVAPGGINAALATVDTGDATDYRDISTVRAIAVMPDTIDSHGVASIGRYVYVWGGSNMATNGIYRYSYDSDTWALVYDLVAVGRERKQVAVCAYGGKLYAFGGTDSLGAAVDWAESYDPETGVRTVLTALATAREDCACAALDGKIYVLGGIDGVGELAENREYDIATDAWANKAAMASERYQGAAVTANGLIYYIGGYVAPPLFNPSDAVIAYDPDTNTWANKGSLVQARGTHAALAITFYGGGAASGGYAMANSRIIKNTENTVWLRPADGFDPFVWGGRCMMIGDITKPRAGVNPTYCQNPQDGGVAITGILRALPGLPTTSLTMKEEQRDSVADDLENCLWDIDRRTYCQNLGDWNSWDKIRRICGSAITERGDNGSSFNEDDAENMTSLSVTGQDVITIQRVAVTVDQTLEQGFSVPAAKFLSGAVCHGERCGSRCNSEKECVVAIGTSSVAAGNAHLLINTRGGDHGYWTDISVTALAVAASTGIVDLLCFGDYVLMASGATTAPDFVVSFDQGVTQISVTGNSDMTAAGGGNGVQCVDGLSQAHIVAAGDGGYLYYSDDGGFTWFTAGGSGVATTQSLSKIMIARDNPSVVYAIGASNALVKSENGGRNYFALTGPSVGDNLTALFVKDEAHLLVGNDDGELWESSDGGVTWSQQTLPPEFTPAAGVTPITDINSCGCGVVWATAYDATNEFVFRNVDGGASNRWYLEEGAQMTADLTADQVPAGVLCCGPNRALVYGGETTGAATGFVAVAA